MIVVLVRDQNGSQFAGFDTGGLEPGLKSPDRHAGIHQQVGLTGLDEERVPGAPATEADDTHSNSILRVWVYDISHEPDTQTLTKQGTTDPHDRGAFLNRYFKVIGHPHRKVPEIRGGELFPESIA